MATFPAPQTGILLTNFIVSRDIARSRRFYVDGAAIRSVVRSRRPNPMRHRPMSAGVAARRRPERPARRRFRDR